MPKWRYTNSGSESTMDASFRAWMAKTREEILEPDLPIIVSHLCIVQTFNVPCV